MSADQTVLPSLEDVRDRYAALDLPSEVQADVEWVEAGGDDVWFDRACEDRDADGYVASRQDDRDRLFASGQVEYAEHVQTELEGLWAPRRELEDREPG